MLKRIFVLGTVGLFLAGCGGSAATICEKLKECFDDHLDLDKCQDDIDDDVNDEKIESKALGECANCLDENTCSELEDGDCSEKCNGLSYSVYGYKNNR